MLLRKLKYYFEKTKGRTRHSLPPQGEGRKKKRRKERQRGREVLARGPQVREVLARGPRGRKVPYSHLQFFNFLL